MSVTISSEESPYAAKIEQFFSLTFPSVAKLNKADMLEGIEATILASSKIRYGPRPSPESLVAIRAVIRKAIDAGLPIPMLSPFGSRKSDLHASLDVAEVFALKQLERLNDRVVSIYSPGVQINIRLEDASGHDEGDESRISSIAYTTAFPKLVYILGLHPFVRPVLESSIFNADAILPFLIHYIETTDDPRNKIPNDLVPFGWRGTIPMEDRRRFNLGERLYSTHVHQSYPWLRTLDDCKRRVLSDALQLVHRVSHAAVEI